MNSSISNNKILVIGASSSLGKSIFKFDKRNKFIGTYYNNRKKRLFKFDPSKENISEKFNLKKISLVVLMHGITKNDECIKNKNFSNYVNITLNKKLIDDLIFNNKPFIFFSTEWVYPGTKKFNDENSRVSPANLYANQKLIVERYIKKNAKKFYILRLAKTYTNNLKDNSFLNNWNKMINNKKSVFKCYKQQFYSPIYSKDIYRFILYVENRKYFGLYNFGGKDRYSRIDCLKIFLNFKNVKKYKIIEQKIPKRYPKDVSVNIDKLKKIKFFPSKFTDNLNKIYKV